MTPPTIDYRRQKQIALTSLVGASLALGIIMAALHLDRPNAVTLLGSIAILVIGFRWLTLDSAELDIRRPMWLNVGIVMAAAIFVPYYLYKTRPKGRRGPAIVAFFGLVLGCAVATEIGATLMLYLSGDITPAQQAGDANGTG
ncbi:MAG TPA: hypothetical protein VKB52_15905 [Rhodanobacteraceae bacterium]|nr:hypothetical protein [Rhodanobacteraceae bacterium]